MFNVNVLLPIHSIAHKHGVAHGTSIILRSNTITQFAWRDSNASGQPFIEIYRETANEMRGKDSDTQSL